MSWNLNEPNRKNFQDIWSLGVAAQLRTPGIMFGTQMRPWYVRESYISLYNDIVNDHERTIQIVNGTGGIGKSCFLLYVLARCREIKKPVLLYIHRNEQDTPTAVYFQKTSAQYTSVKIIDSTTSKKFEAWYELIGRQESFLLVDGIPSFPRDDVPGVKYIVATSSGCSLRSMEKDSMRRDRWLERWTQGELIFCANSANIPTAIEAIEDNFMRIGGICRYAFVPGAARDAISTALAAIGARELFRFVTQDLNMEYIGDRQKNGALDRITYRCLPAGNTGNRETKIVFSSEFVNFNVAFVLALAEGILTTELKQFISATTCSNCDILFRAYVIRRLLTPGLLTVINNEFIDLNKMALDKVLNRTDFNGIYRPPTEFSHEFVLHPRTIGTIDFFRRTSREESTAIIITTNLDLIRMKVRQILECLENINLETFPHLPIPHKCIIYVIVPEWMSVSLECEQHAFEDKSLTQFTIKL